MPAVGKMPFATYRDAANAKVWRRLNHDRGAVKQEAVGLNRVVQDNGEISFDAELRLTARDLLPARKVNRLASNAD